MLACSAILGVVVAVVAGLRIWLAPHRFSNPPDVAVSIGKGGREQRLRRTIAEHGYAHVQGLFNRSELEAVREIAYNFCYGDPRRAWPLAYGGYSVPDFLSVPEFAGAHWIRDDQRLHVLLRAAFGGDKFKFASHNDVGCDFVGVWHKDVLRGQVAKYQECDMWSVDRDGEQHEIYKIIFYLEDHLHDDLGMKVIPGSHLVSSTPWEKGYVAVHSQVGDAVIFDQRLSHAGNQHYNPLGQGRIFLQVGFGRDNWFTDQFAIGSNERQQSRLLQAFTPRGISTILTDIKMGVVGALFSALPPQLLNHFADKAIKNQTARNCSTFGRQG